jgi:tRNA(Ile)-lysidine synthase
MTRHFEQRLAEAWPGSDWRRVPVVIAVSGGADSVALLRGLVSLAGDAKSRLIVGHFNHGLRVSAGNDEEFVVELSARLGVRCAVGRPVQDLKHVAGGSLEEAARDARYEFLTATAKQVGARYLVTAHTADDQAETILLRFVRGTGLAGLAGIPRMREIAPGITLVRPLLAQRRGDVVAYLSQLGQSYCDDESNADLRFTRNRLRHELLPHLATYNPQVVESLQRLGQLAAEATEYLVAQAEQLLNRYGEFRASEFELDCRPLRDESPLLVRELLRGLWRRQDWPEQDMSFEKWEELRRLIQAPSIEDSQRLNLPGDLLVTRCGERLSVRGQRKR